MRSSGLNCPQRLAHPTFKFTRSLESFTATVVSCGVPGVYLNCVSVVRDRRDRHSCTDAPGKIGAGQLDRQLSGRLGFQHTSQLPHEIPEHSAQDGGDHDEEQRI
jgi:hypothetical protein